MSKVEIMSKEREKNDWRKGEREGGENNRRLWRLREIIVPNLGITELREKDEVEEKREEGEKSQKCRKISLSPNSLSEFVNFSCLTELNFRVINSDFLLSLPFSFPISIMSLSSKLSIRDVELKGKKVVMR
jgi:hypothetical protein